MLKKHYICKAYWGITEYTYIIKICLDRINNKINIEMEVTITTENFESLKNGEMPLVVDFWATWCGPCRAIAPYIEELAKEYDGKIVVGKCDVEENDDIVMEFGVRNIPTILFFKGGEVVDRLVGGQSKSAIQKKFEALL